MVPTEGSVSEPEVPTGLLSGLASDSLNDGMRAQIHVLTGDDAIPPLQKHQFERSEPENDGLVNSGGKDDITMVDVPELKMEIVSESGALAHDVTPIIGAVDREVRAASGSSEIEGRDPDDQTSATPFREDAGVSVAFEACVHGHLPASTTHTIASEDTGLHDPSIVPETGPPTEQRVPENINRESVETDAVPPPTVHHATADERLHDEPDVIPNTSIQHQDDSPDPVEPASIPEPAVTALGFEAAKEGVREIAQDSAGYGSASHRSPGNSPDKSPGKSPEVPAQSDNVQSTSHNEFPENDFQSMIENLDVDSNETDSTMGEMAQSSTMSLNSGLYEHVEENGRSYHRYKQGKYALPNDETERNRLDLQHHLFLLTLHGELHLAPLKPGIHNVLDIATGTGIWAIEFAAKYPSANVIGTDLSPIQPLFVPPNCHFEVDDAEDDWVYSHKFDYIHGRLLLSCFRSFPSIVSKAHAALEPGGWFELQDMLPPTCLDDSWNGTDLQRWVGLTLEGAARLGMDWQKVSKYKMWLEEAGFIDIQEVQLAWPCNTWPRNRHHKLLGIWMNQNLLEGLHAISIAVLTRGIGMTPQEVELLLVGVRKDICNRNIHSYAPIRVVYGRKPGRENTRVGLGVDLGAGASGLDEVQSETVI